jgi:hypothetical protein
MGIPTTVMMCLDWWVWELMILTSGYLGTNAQASQVVMMNIILLG